MAAVEVPGYEPPGRKRYGAQRKPRVCRGYATVDGQVACTASLEAYPTGARTCAACLVEYKKHSPAVHNKKRNKRRREERAEKRAAAGLPPIAPVRGPRTCPGYESNDGAVSCGEELGPRHGRVKRCPKCTPLHKLWYDRIRASMARTPPTSKRYFDYRHPRGDDREHVPHKPCDECFDLTERRPTQGLCKCGHPWRKEVIERREVLRSNAGGEMHRNRFG